MFKKLLLIILATLSLYAEATFDQVQSMIEAKDYKQATLALTVITINHPNSAKPFYALAQAQAGLGNLQAAREAFTKAKALNPKLDFVPESQVKDFAKTINMVIEVKKIKQESHWLLWLFGLSSLILVWFFFFRKKSICPTEIKIKEDIPSYTPRPTYTSRRPEETSSPIMNQASGYYPEATRPKRGEVHHYYHDQSRGSDLGTTILASAATAAVVSSLMDDDSHSHRSYSTESYRPSCVTPEEPVISNSWEDSTPSTSSSWEDTSSSSSSSWSDSSSSSSSDSSSSSWD